MKNTLIITFAILTLFSCSRDEEITFCSNDSNLFVSAVLDGEEKVIGNILELNAVSAPLVLLGEGSSIISRWEGESFEWTFQLILPDILFEENETYTYLDDLSFYLNTGSLYSGINGSLYIEELEYTENEIGTREINKIKATLNGQYQKNGGPEIFDINMTFCGIINE